MVKRNDDVKLVKRAPRSPRKTGGVVKRHVVVPDYQEQVTRELQECASRPFQFFHPDMLTAKGWTGFKDPTTGKIVTARLAEVRWLEIRRDVEKKDDAVQLVEAFRPVRLEPQDVLTYFGDVNRKHRRLREGIPPGSYGSYDDWTQLAAALPGGEYLPMPPGPYTRQLYLSDMWAMQAKAFEAYNHNPVAKALVDMKAAFIVGTGITVTCDADEVQDVVDEFMERERLNERLLTWARMRIVNGELFVEPVEVMPGYVGVRSVDPATVWEIITEPRDIEKVYGYWLQYATQYQIKTEKASGGNAQVSEYVIELLPPDRLLHVKANVQENEKRGRSDLFAVLGWLKWLKDFYMYKVIRAVAEASWTWDHTVKGDDTDVSRIAAQFTTWPTPGSEYIHNEAESRTMVAFDGAAGSQRSAVGDELLNLVCVGMGIPKEYMGIGDASTRATAITATEPAAKLFQAHQKQFEGLVRDIIKRVVKAAQDNGRLPAGVEDGFEVSFPEIAPEEKDAKLRRLEALQRGGVISHKRMANMAAKEDDISDYNYDDEQAEIAAENQAAQDRAGAFLYPPTEEPPEDAGAAPAPAAAPEIPPAAKPTRSSMGGATSAERRAVKSAGSKL